MRYVCGLDANHGEIKKLFLRLCPAVFDTSGVGGGFPDLVIKTSLGRVYLVEIKDGSKKKSARKLRTKQRFMQAMWGSSYQVVETEEQAMTLALTLSGDRRPGTMERR